MIDDKKFMNKDMILTILFSVFIVLAFFELFIVYNLYLNADKVECNGILCKFTSIEGTKDINVTKNISRICYENGKQINCSEIENFNKNTLNYPS